MQQTVFALTLINACFNPVQSWEQTLPDYFQGEPWTNMPDHLAYHPDPAMLFPGHYWPNRPPLEGYGPLSRFPMQADTALVAHLAPSTIYADRDFAACFVDDDYQIDPDSFLNRDPETHYVWFPTPQDVEDEDARLAYERDHC